MRFLILSVSILALSGCRTLMDPTFLPTAYTHHQKEYKAPPGPESRHVGYDYSRSKNKQVVGEFINAANDLVTELETQTGLTPQAIFIQNRLRDSAFNNSYDYALREAFRAKGYTLANASEVFASRLTFEAISVSDKPNQLYFKFIEKEGVYDDFELVLNLYQGEIAPHVTSKTYTLPSFGYTTTSELADKEKQPAIIEPKVERTQDFELLGENN
ncbi:hypothetical protein N9Z27_01200 [Alphaproteobacteria bacterium]|nr:hypothetical protein [Alphaproteobacteria bacterium]